MWHELPLRWVLLNSTKELIWYRSGEGDLLWRCLPWSRSVFLPKPKLVLRMDLLSGRLYMESQLHRMHGYYGLASLNRSSLEKLY